MRRANGLTALDARGGIPLGIDEKADYETGSLQLACGDTLFLYTDGVTEAMDNGSSFYSDRRLRETLRPLAGAPASKVLEEVMASVRAFSSGAPQTDDIAALTIRLADAA